MLALYVSCALPRPLLPTSLSPFPPSPTRALCTCTRRAQLSLEDNEIESLSGLSKVSTLLELYLGNNKVSDMREVLQLRTLPKLIILDLSGNEVCARPEYRLYSIFHLKKLKVLDGLGVESSEQAAANDTYSGRLTEEFVVEKLGHKFFDHVSELDLSSNKIRDTANCITGEVFGNLRVLNLDNNMISDLSGLTGLSVLAVLRLNHNRIESLGPDKPPRGPEAPMCGLQTLSSLEVLQLGFNDIHTLSACKFLPLGSLKVLFLQGNDITRLDGLESLSQVRELVLDKNKIRHVDFGALLSLINLRELRVEENGLKSLSNFTPLPRLQALHLGSNRIADMSDMDKLTALPCLLDLTLSNNPIARKQLYRATAIQKLPTLRILDNKEITVEERDRVDVLFAMETRTTPTYLSAGAAHGPSHTSNSHLHHHQQPSMQGAISKVPIKMSSMTFDHLGGPMSHGIGGSLAGPSQQQASFVCIGLSKNTEQQVVSYNVSAFVCLCLSVYTCAQAYQQVAIRIERGM
jgi:Leucine-rich repeat (LRR) protein